MVCKSCGGGNLNAAYSRYVPMNRARTAIITNQVNAATQQANSNGNRIRQAILRQQTRA